MIKALNLRVTILATTLFLTGFSHSISGQTNSTTDTKARIPFQNKKGNNSGRPRMPTHQLITGEYCDGYLTVSFQIPEGNCVLTYSIGNSGFKTSFPFDSSKEASFFLGNCTSVINISITTSFENEYEAVIDLTS